MLLQQYVLPVVRWERGLLKGVLGTAFIAQFGKHRLVITAGHVADTALANKWEWGVVYTLDSGELHFATANAYVRSKRHDVAAVPLNDFVAGLPVGGLQFGSPDYALDQDLCTFEYSQSHLLARPGEPVPDQALVPYFHKGHAMRRFLELPLDPDGEPRLEVSFPALQGASGAPVLNTANNSVVGMLIGNQERHLLPAQVVTIECDDGRTEATSYFLPMGVALDVRAVLDFLENENPQDCIVGCDPVESEPAE
jgi:hypothetical protein